MARREVKVTEYACDNPRCSTVRTSNPDLPDEPVHGLSGDVVVIDGTGGWGAKWWACKLACVKPAIVARLEGA